jgi:hypothetical protein
MITTCPAGKQRLLYRSCKGRRMKGKENEVWLVSHKPDSNTIMATPSFIFAIYCITTPPPAPGGSYCRVIMPRLTRRMTHLHIMTCRDEANGSNDRPINQSAIKVKNGGTTKNA